MAFEQTATIGDGPVRAFVRQATAIEEIVPIDFFDTVASVYHRTRPSYPALLIDDVMEFGGLRAGMNILEIGAGTGQATLQFANRGLRMHCIEPSERMAAILRTVCLEQKHITIRVGTFEDLAIQPGYYDAVIAAQSWHWLRPGVRLQRAARALKRLGIIAVFWNETPSSGRELMDDFRRAYQRYAPELTPRTPTAPAVPATAECRSYGFAEGSPSFGSVVMKGYRQSRSYTADDFISLLDTYPSHQALPVLRRLALYRSLHESICAAGGNMTMPFGTILHMAKRVDAESAESAQ